MVAEVKTAGIAHLEAQLEAFKAHTQELHQLGADMDDDLVSDS